MTDKEISTQRQYGTWAADDIVAQLREQSTLMQGEAWRRTDGGQNLCLSAKLADKAADEIERLRALPPLRAREEIAREAQEAADRITRGLAISGWMPRRSNIETARNDLQKIADAILSSPAGQECRRPEGDADKAFSEWAWLKTGEPIGCMAPHVAARLAFKAGAEWAAAPPVVEQTTDELWKDSVGL